MDLPTVLNTEGLDCRSCGACCKAHRTLPSETNQSYVPLRPEDITRMTSEQREEYLLETSPNKFAIKLTSTLRCAALSGEIGNCVSCEIYDNRPRVCRDFEKGDYNCHYARSEVGLGPFGS